MNIFNAKTPAELADAHTTIALRSYRDARLSEPRPTQAELEAACKAGRAEYDAQRAPRFQLTTITVEEPGTLGTQRRQITGKSLIIREKVRTCTKCGHVITGDFVPGTTCRNSEACKQRAAKREQYEEAKRAELAAIACPNCKRYNALSLKSTWRQDLEEGRHFLPDYTPVYCAEEGGDISQDFLRSVGFKIETPRLWKEAK